MRTSGLPIVVLIICLASALAGCGGGTSCSLSNAPNPANTTASTGAQGNGPVITGRVVDIADSSPVVGARVRLGTAEDASGADGGFSITLPVGSTVASIGSSTILITADQHSSQQVPLPPYALTGEETDLGVIALVTTAEDGDTPPPPPVFDE